MRILFAIFLLIVNFIVLQVPSSVWCYELGSGKYAIDIHGSASQGYIYSKDNNILVVDTEGGTFEFNEFFFIFTMNILPNLRFGAQLLSRRFGDYGFNNQIKLDWGYFDYNVDTWLGLRLGRVKLPIGFYHEIVDIDIARSTIWLPPLYLRELRDFYSNGDGAVMYGSFMLNRLGRWDYQVILADTEQDQGNSLEYEITHDNFLKGKGNSYCEYLYGGKLFWESPVRGLHLGYSYMKWVDGKSNMTLESDLLTLLGIPQGSPLHFYYDSGKLLFYSLEYTYKNFILSSELSRFTTETSVDELRFIPQFDKYVQKFGGWYVQLSYRWNNWLSTSVGYSTWYRDFHNRNHSNTYDFFRESYGALCFDLMDNLTFKIEAHHVNGLMYVWYDRNPANDRKNNFMFYACKVSMYF